ncbi:hypothetical protein IFM12275_13640 [Nocardia sputorum]|nr:hypothetical protein IFM12275_13640 [Nocardia sputorum]
MSAEVPVDRRDTYSRTTAVICSTDDMESFPGGALATSTCSWQQTGSHVWGMRSARWEWPGEFGANDCSQLGR